MQYTDAIDFNLVAQAFFTSCYLISSFFISFNAYAGLISMFSGLIFVLSIATTYYYIRIHTNKLIFGAVLGSSSVIVFISLQTAIFWGQYSSCEKLPVIQRRISNATYFKSLIIEKGNYGNECYGNSAMKSICVFSALLFITYIILVATLVFYKDEILETSPFYVNYSPVPQNISSYGRNEESIVKSDHEPHITCTSPSMRGNSNKTRFNNTIGYV